MSSDLNQYNPLRKKTQKAFNSETPSNFQEITPEEKIAAIKRRNQLAADSYSKLKEGK